MSQMNARQDYASTGAMLQDEARTYDAHTLDCRVAALAAPLARSGCRRLALYADNSIDWVVADRACQSADVVCVPLPLWFSWPQIVHVLQGCGIDAVLTGEPRRFAGQFRPLEEEAGGALTLMVRPPPPQPPLPDGTGKITFTSGSTGAPRGVCLSTEQQYRQARTLAAAVDVQKPAHLCALPMSTLLENIAGIYAPLLAGGTVTIRSLASLGFAGSRLAEPAKFLQTLTHARPDTLILIPQLLQLLVRAVDQGWQPPPFSFIAVGGARVPVGLLLAARERGLPVYEGYGLSECASVVSLNTAGADRPGTCGQVLPGLQVSVEHGELVVAGNAMLGYVDDPRSWYPQRIATGDLGHRDAGGFVHIDGRVGNVLISSYGRNVSPEWVESELLASPLVDEAVVFGDAQPYCVALLSPAHAAVADAQLAAAVAQANAMLPDYAQIRRWSRLPRRLAETDGLVTANGRPRRDHIAAHHRSRINELYEAPQDGARLSPPFEDLR